MTVRRSITTMIGVQEAGHLQLRHLTLHVIPKEPVHQNIINQTLFVIFSSIECGISMNSSST
jgi:hypothetical protein